MLHVILKAGRLLRPEGVAEFRTAVAGITQVKPFTRVRRGRLERVKGYPRAKAELIKKLKDKAWKLRHLADATEDQGKIKSYYRKANKLDERAHNLEAGMVDPKESKKRFGLWLKDLERALKTTSVVGAVGHSKIIEEARQDKGMSAEHLASLESWLEEHPLKEKKWNHDRVREWAKDIARDLIGEVQGEEVSDEMMYEVAKSHLFMDNSLRKYLITDQGLESRQAMAEWLTDEIATQVNKHFWDSTTSRVVSRRD